MKYGYSRLYKPVLAIALTTGALAACYQSVWKADYQSDVENGRHYALTSAVDAQGNLLVGGSSTVAITQDANSNDIVHFQPTILKYAPNGTLLWEFHFDNGQRRTTARPAASPTPEYQGGAEIQHLVTDTAGNVYAAGIVPGSNYSSDSHNYDVAVFHLDANGSLLWSRVIEQPEQDNVLTLGLSPTGKLLLGVHHYDHRPAAESEFTSVLALNTEDGNIAWQHHHEPMPEGEPSLYSTRYSLNISPSHAATNGNRIAISQRISLFSAGEYLLSDTLYVYGENGDLLWQQLPESETGGPGAATDIGTACSGDVASFKLANGLAFADDDLIVARVRGGLACYGTFAWLGLERHDASGNRVWATEVPDPQNPDELGQTVEDYANGVTNWFQPLLFRAMFSDAHIATDDDGIYLATTGVSLYLSPFIYDRGISNPATVSSLVTAVSLNGESRWIKSLEKNPVLVGEDENGFPLTVNSTWLTTSGIALTAAGKPVIALNELSTQGYAVDAASLNDTELTAAGSRLVEFDPATGKQDSFASEPDYLARHVATNKGKGVFKSGDDYLYLPAFKPFIPAGTPDTASNIHVNHLRAR